jgi:hypothetical protein
LPPRETSTERDTKQLKIAKSFIFAGPNLLPLSAARLAPPGSYPLFVDGLTITPVGGVTHLLFTTRQSSVPGSDRMERVVQARLVVPNEQLQTMGRLPLSGRGAERLAAVEDADGEPVKLQ